MRKLIKYARHILRAKGRHGTHSPFIYSFVENVMRPRRQVRESEVIRFFSSEKRAALFLRMIRFLRPSALVVPDDHYGEWLSLCNKLPDHIKVLTYSEATEVRGANRLIWVNGKLPEEDFRRASALLACPQSQLLFSNPHFNKATGSRWADLCRMDAVRFSIDLWYYGWLSNDDAFKVRQHFYLK